MTAIMLVGDTHSDPNALPRIFAEGRRLGIRQYVHVGDLNVWPPTAMGAKANAKFLPRLVEQLCDNDAELIFVRGNHDNLDALETWPLHGSGVRRYGSRLSYAPNGHRWAWGGRTFLALGGAYSVDEESQRRDGLYSERETIARADVDSCIGDGPVDIIVAHDAPLTSGFDYLPDLFKDHSREHTKTDANTVANRRLLGGVVFGLQPHTVIHGHYHVHGLKSVPTARDDTRVIALGKNGELGGYAVLDLETLGVTFLGSK